MKKFILFLVPFIEFRKSNRPIAELNTANARKSYRKYSSPITIALVCNETTDIRDHPASPKCFRLWSFDFAQDGSRRMVSGVEPFA